MDRAESMQKSQGRKARWWLWLALPAVAAVGFGTMRAYAFASDMGMAGMALTGDGTPEEHRAFMQRRLEKMLDLVKATDSQREAIKNIAERLHAEIGPIHQEHARLHGQLKQALTAPTVDAAAVESLRTQASALLDRASKAISKALVDAGNVLTLEQRQTLVKEMEQHHGRRHHL